MATSLEYLEQKLADTKEKTASYRRERDVQKAQYKVLFTKQAILIDWLSSHLFGRQAKKAELAIVQQQISVLSLAMQKTQKLIGKGDAEIIVIETAIAKYLEAVNTGISSGMSDPEAQDYGNRAVETDVANMQGQEDAETMTEANKKIINNILLGAAGLILTIIIIYFVRKRSKKSKK